MLLAFTQGADAPFRLEEVNAYFSDGYQSGIVLVQPQLLVKRIQIFVQRMLYVQRMNTQCVAITIDVCHCAYSFKIFNPYRRQ